MVTSLTQGHVLHKVLTFAISLNIMAKHTVNCNNTFYEENKFVLQQALGIG
jgi:hypothetical protein